MQCRVNHSNSSSRADIWKKSLTSTYNVIDDIYWNGGKPPITLIELSKHDMQRYTKNMIMISGLSCNNNNSPDGTSFIDTTYSEVKFGSNLIVQKMNLHTQQDMEVFEIKVCKSKKGFAMIVGIKNELIMGYKTTIQFLPSQVDSR